MTAPLDLSLAFIAGLLGSGHCVGMCGSLVSAFFVRMGERGRGFLPMACYHAGRIGIYGIIGVVAASLGVALVSTGIVGKAQAVLQILAGALVLVLALDLVGWLPVRLPAVGLPPVLAGRIFADAGRRGAAGGALLGGVVNGLMPCAMTLSMAVKATSAATPLEGALLMLSFGMGTLPAMTLVGTLFSRLGAPARGWLLRGAAGVVAALGGVTLVEGLRFFAVMRNLPNW